MPVFNILSRLLPFSELQINISKQLHQSTKRQKKKKKKKKKKEENFVFENLAPKSSLVDPVPLNCLLSYLKADQCTKIMHTGGSLPLVDRVFP